MIYRFTKSAEKVLSLSNEIAQELGHSYIGTEHILYGLCVETNGVAGKVLNNQNITPEIIVERIDELIGSEKKENFAVLGFTPRSKKILENSYIESKKLGSNYIGTEHILVGIIKEDDSLAMKILEDCMITKEILYKEIAKTLNEFDEIINSEKQKDNDKKQNKEYQYLNQFGEDLTRKSRRRKTRSSYWKN